jgi:DNA polymerase-3 subunit beta
MRLSLKQENLTKALASVGRVVSTRASLPVLSNVLIATDGNRLRLSATNLEIGINYWVGAKIDRPGSLTIPARLFAEFVASLPHGNIDLEATETSLTVKTSHYQSKINGISADEFPPIPQVTSEPVLSLDAAVLKDALTQVVIAASLDEARPVLAGVYMYTADEKLFIVATDSYRLAEKQLDMVAASTKDMAVIVPVRTMQELIRLLGEADGNVDIYLDDNQIMFRVNEVELVSRLIEGKFPNYKQIIPTAVETSFDISTAEFTRIVKVASLFARESAGSIKIEIKSEGEVSIVSSDSEVGGNTSTAECEVSGEDGEISLNARYLQDALSIIKTPNVTFAISGKLNPCMIYPSGEDIPDDYLHIVMPLRT